MAKREKKQDEDEQEPPVTIETVQTVPADRVTVVKGVAVVADDPDPEIFYVHSNAEGVREVKVRRGSIRPLVLGERMANEDEIAEYKRARGIA